MGTRRSKTINDELYSGVIVVGAMHVSYGIIGIFDLTEFTLPLIDIKLCRLYSAREDVLCQIRSRQLQLESRVKRRLTSFFISFFFWVFYNRSFREKEMVCLHDPYVK